MTTTKKFFVLTTLLGFGMFLQGQTTINAPSIQTFVFQNPYKVITEKARRHGKLTTSIVPIIYDYKTGQRLNAAQYRYRVDPHTYDVAISLPQPMAVVVRIEYLPSPLDTNRVSDLAIGFSSRGPSLLIAANARPDRPESLTFANQQYYYTFPIVVKIDPSLSGAVHVYLANGETVLAISSPSWGSSFSKSRVLFQGGVSQYPSSCYRLGSFVLKNGAIVGSVIDDKATN